MSAIANTRACATHNSSPFSVPHRGRLAQLSQITSDRTLIETPRFHSLRITQTSMFIAVNCNRYPVRSLSDQIAVYRYRIFSVQSRNFLQTSDVVGSRCLHFQPFRSLSAFHVSPKPWNSIIPRNV